MKNKSILPVVLIVVTLVAGRGVWVAAQDKLSAQKYEYALLKYDGPDKIQIFYPDRFEFMRLFEKGHKLPKDAHDEEFCVATAVNTMAKDGWEPIQLHATRVLFRRPATK